MESQSSILKSTKQLEHVLIKYYHASGRNLDELITSCQDRFSKDLVNCLRFIAFLSQEVANGKNAPDEELKAFHYAYHECEKKLQPRSNKMIWRLVGWLIFLVTAGSIWIYIENWQQITAF